MLARAVWFWFGVLALVFAAISAPASAQDNYPASPVKVVVAFPPSGTTDVVARLLAQRFSVQMNVNAYAENRPGAGGNMGAEFVAKARPDGYTLLLNTSSLVLSPALGEKLGYDVLRDLAPVALVASTPQVLVVHPSVPAAGIAEFVAYLKANPNKLAYGSGGIGGIAHLGPLLLLQAHGVTALHVPYKGAAPAMIDLAGGRVQFAIQSMTTVLPLAKDGRIRVLAVTSLKRSPLLPGTPTLAETMAGFEIGNWYGLVAPAHTPAAVVKRLNAEILKALQEPEVKARLAKEDAEPLGSTPEEYGAYIRGELDRWTRVVKTAGVKAE